MQPAIRIQGLGKRYQLGIARARYQTLRERLVETALGPFRRIQAVLQGRSTSSSKEHIWAVQDVSFDVMPGEVVGLIGRNGAGKTTLLKLLARITEPTVGRAEVRGRIASLLEVGTGFHPELTGRENIFLNGAILGMRRHEIRRRFDDIVAFAEVERFIDTQVKHYSSGMYLRLAFAVAAHLEPEILLVDEVLAVGDAAFQKRCLGKMSEVTRAGRTVLFVSHNMEAVQRLCERGVWLDRGGVVADGQIDDVIRGYLRQWSAAAASSSYRLDAASADSHADRAVLLEADVVDSEGRACSHVSLGEPFGLRLRWLHRDRIHGAEYLARVFDQRERFLFGTNTQRVPLGLEAAGVHEVVCRVESNVLVPGEYTVTVGCFVPPNTRMHQVEACVSFGVFETPFEGRHIHVNRQAIFAPPTRWTAVAPVGVAATIA
jgi:lipopolysaccharide transport system ATP-binding protein